MLNCGLLEVGRANYDISRHITTLSVRITTYENQKLLLTAFISPNFCHYRSFEIILNSCSLNAPTESVIKTDPIKAIIK